MSSFDTDNIKVFDNVLIAQKFENQLTTSLDMNQFITTDYTLAANPGMSIEIHTYKGTGAVEDLAMKAGNSQEVGAEYETSKYDVVTTQGKVPYYDEQIAVDPAAVDKAVQHLGELMTNDLSAKIVAELGKGTNVKYGATFDFASVVDALAQLPYEDVSSTYMLISKQDYAKVQKSMKDDLKYVDQIARTGYVGSVAGVPVFVSMAVKAGTAYIAQKSAVTNFVKKGVEIEQERDADHRKTTIYARKVMVVALTDDTRVVVLKAEDPTSGYTVLTEEPEDWSESATNYFEVKDSAMTAVQGTPAFKPYRYFKQND